METTWLTIAQWMLRAGVGGGAILALTLFAMRRVKQPARRQRLGEAGLLAALALAVLALWPAWIPIHYGAAEAPRVDFDIAILQAAPAAGQTPPFPALAVAMPDTHRAAADAPPEWTDGLQPALMLLVALYTGGAAIFLIRWLLGLMGLRRLIRASASADAALLAEFAAHLPTRRLPRLLISRRLRVPVSCGIWRPTVILPAALASDAERERRAWIFAHELTHLERRDAWSCVLFALGQAVFFPVPWFWRVQRDVRLCQEFVADAAAVKHQSADEYASFLLTLTTAPVVPRVATGVTGSKSDLYRRVTMLLENPLPVERRCPAWWTAGAAGALVGLAVFGAGVGLAQAPPNQREVLQQLDRIQEMVNKLRRQVAETPGPAAAATDLDGPRVETRKSDDQAKQQALELEKRRLSETKVLYDRNLAAAQKALASAAQTTQNRQLLETWIRGRVEETAKKPDAERAELIRRLFLDLRGTVPTAEEMSKYLTTPQDRLVVILNDAAQRRPTVAAPRAAWIDFVQAPREDQLKKAYDLLNAYRDKLKKQPPANKEEVQKQIDELIEQLNQALQASAKATVRFADPNRTATVLGELVLKPTTRGRLGVRLDQPSDILREQLNLPQSRGLVIVEVFDGSVAKKAGIQVNDILLKLGDQEVESDAEKTAQAVAAIKPDAKLDIVVLRRGKPTTIQGVVLPASHLVLSRLVNPAQLTVTVQRAGDNLVARRHEGTTRYTVEAAPRDGKPEVRKITIVEDGKSREFNRLEDVPQEHRSKVEPLIRAIGSLSTSSLPVLADPLAPNVNRDRDVLAPAADSFDLEVVIPKQDRK
jgi:beta-lactamase regulating signal transducer with metallopeptidase domain